MLSKQPLKKEENWGGYCEARGNGGTTIGVMGDRNGIETMPRLQFEADKFATHKVTIGHGSICPGGDFHNLCW